MALRERSLAEESARRAQQLEVDRQEKQIRLQLEQRRLEEASEKNKQQAQWAFQKWQETQAEREMQRRFTAEQQQKRLDSQQALQQARFGEQEKLQGDRLAARTTPLPEDFAAHPVPDEQGKPIPGLVRVPTPTGWRTMPEPGFVGQQAGNRLEKFHQTQNRLSVLKGKRAEILKEFPVGTRRPDDAANPKLAPRAKAYDSAQSELKKISDEMQRLAPPVTDGTGTAPAAQAQDFPPAPANAKDRKADQTYKTPKGLYTWTGQGWAPYAAAAHDEEGDGEPADENGLAPADPDNEE